MLQRTLKRQISLQSQTFQSEEAQAQLTAGLLAKQVLSVMLPGCNLAIWLQLDNSAVNALACRSTTFADRTLPLHRSRLI